MEIESVPEMNRFRRGIRFKKVGHMNHGRGQQRVGEGWRLWLFGRYTWVCGRRVSGKGDFGNWRMAVGEGEGFPSPSPRGQALCGNNGGRDGSPHARGQRWGGRFANRPYRGEGDRRGVGRWVPASARTRRGRGGLAYVRGEWEGAPPSPVFTRTGCLRE